MKPEEVCHPTPEQMTTALLEAARAGRWNHWRHEVKTHADDWVEAGAIRKPLAAEQFAQLPAAVAEYQFVELCVYWYRRKVVWGYYCKRLPFAEGILVNVLVVFNPQAEEIVHCMYPDRGKKYCQRWGEQGKLFVEVRW